MSETILEPVAPAAPKTVRRRPALERAGTLLRDPVTLVCLVVLAGLAGMALLAPLIAGDPAAIDPVNRLKPPGGDYLMGTDHLGRDVFARTVYGARVSLGVAFSVAVLATVPGVMLGLLAGLTRRAGWVVMRLTDAMMAIPAVLLAIALAALLRPGVWTVIIAIAIPEVPRMIRLVRAVTLGVRAQPYVDAAVASGTRGAALVMRHILPNTLAPVMVQATYAAASAVIASAILSFLGVGTAPDTPSWGGMMADARRYFRLYPMLMFWPGLMLALLVLVVNVLGDRLSDALDPRKLTRGGTL
ncbi:MAG: ABC transporter permease [Pseudomonadota bacterium]